MANENKESSNEASNTNEQSDGVIKGSADPNVSKASAKNPKKSVTDSVKSNIVEGAASKVTPGGQETVEKVKKAQETVKKLKAAKSAATTTIATTKTALLALLAIVFDPIFWIVFGIIAAIVLISTSIVAGTHIIGKNENAEGCIPSGDSGGGVQAVTSENIIETGNSIAGTLTSTNFAFLGNKPMTIDQAAALIGNWTIESKLIPGAVQPVVSDSGLSNSQLKGLGTIGGRAAGLAQWDGGRRLALANFAESKGGIWSDINIQLEYLSKELSGWEGANLLAGGFNDQSKSADELTLIFMAQFERAGKPHMEGRYAATKSFLENYNGGYSGSTGGSCLMASGGGVNSSDAVSLSISLSYERSADSRVSGSDSYGVGVAKQEYKDAKAKAMKEVDQDPMATLYASCDRFVATVIKLTTDPDIPWGSTINQGQYLANSPKWQRYETKSQAQPGDVWVTKTRGHIIMYIGDYKGTDSIAHASYLHRVAAIDPSSYLNENLVDNGGRPYYGYRYIG